MRRKALVGMLFICTMILFLCAFVSSASASTLYVPDDYSTIQAAVNAANAGDEIIVRDGVYTENVDVNKRLTVRSENGADFTTVKSTKSYEFIFEIRADHVNISGFTVIGTTAYCDGISLFSDSGYCNISYNIVSSNSHGICIIYSNNNKISNNTILNNIGRGIDIVNSNNNKISNNNVSNNIYGLSIEYSDSNVINNNNIINNNCGISLEVSNNNIISNNSVTNSKGYAYKTGSHSHNNKMYLNSFINNTDNAYPYSMSLKMNSTEKITYTYEDKTYTSYLGNYWSDYTGSDANGDGIGDSPYPISTTGSDVYPLMKKFEVYFTKTKPIKTPEEKTELPSEEEKSISGFEAVFAITGLLAVAYLLRGRG